jgi:hypothetical protein
MFQEIKNHLKSKLSDDKLVANLFASFYKISERFVAQDPPGVLRHSGQFVEAALRVSEHFVTGTHTPLKSNFNVDACVKHLEGVSGSDGLRIHVGRLSRALYDFRSRKNAVHLKDVDPLTIDAALIYQMAAWIMIEILKESEIPNPEEAIRFLASRKIPLVQEIDGLLRTTNPNLGGPERLLVLLYSAVDGLTEAELLSGARTKIRDVSDVRTYLKRHEHKDLVHKMSNGKWVLFGKGPLEVEKILETYG